MKAPGEPERDGPRHPARLGADRGRRRRRSRAGVGDVWDDYVYLVDVKQDNERLAYDNARLREQVHALEQAQVENRQLRRLLQLKDSMPGDAVSAQVVGKDFTEFFRVTRIVLDKGARDVRPHMPVVAPDGVVGAVLHVAGDTVDVQLAVDAAFGVDVEDERTHARGFVRGTGDPARYGCKVEMVDSRDEVEIGDLLVTSGKGRWFPKGHPGRARHEGAQARARTRSGRRRDADGGLLAPRRGAPPRDDAGRGGRSDRGRRQRRRSRGRQ